MEVISSHDDQQLSLKLFIVLTRAAQSIKKRVEADIRRYGLNPTEFAVLELLYHKGEQPIQKIGQKVLIVSSSITYVVDKLEQKNYVTRKPCPHDRRVTYASITEAGTQLMRDIFPKHQQAIHEMLNVLDVAEKQHLIELLKKVGLEGNTA